MSCLQKAPSKPMVSLPLANRFKEYVAMGLKFYKGKISLHMIDNATRLSVTSSVPSKKPEHIANSIMKNWVAVYGSVDKFLTNNSGEFVNDALLHFCEALNIRLKTTGAELPWSHGLVERHSSTIRNVE